MLLSLVFERGDSVSVSVMQHGEESSSVPPVDCANVRVRRSRPVGPPPPSNIFDVSNLPSSDGGVAGTLQPVHFG